VKLGLHSKKLQKPLFWLAFAAGSFAIIISRNPSSITNPQFWAEDGRNWYADAYNHGILYSLATPEAGYFQTFSRLVAIVSQAFELDFAPLFFFLVAAAVQITVAAFIASDRLADFLPEKKWRLALAFGYLAMPHSWEVFANVTNSQWHLAMLACLIIAARPPGGRTARIFDLAAVSIMAVSGPFCLILAPIVAAAFLRSREKHLRLVLAVVVVGAVLQAASLLSFERPIQPDLGVSADSWARIVARHLAISPILGSRGFEFLARTPIYSPAVVFVAAGLAASGFVAMAFGGCRELRALSVFSMLTVASALISPAVSPEPGQWSFIAANDTAIRYWFIPTFTIYAGILRLVATAENDFRPKIIGGALAVASLGGVIFDWRLPRRVDYRFREYAAEFKRLPAGTVFEIPINPNWKMTLIKK